MMFSANHLTVPGNGLTQSSWSLRGLLGRDNPPSPTPVYKSSNVLSSASFQFKYLQPQQHVSPVTSLNCHWP